MRAPAALAGVLAAAFLATPAQAAGTEAVDKMLNACLDRAENQSTAGMTTCMTAAAAEYDRALDAIFQKVVQSLDPASRDLVRAAQRQWLAFRRAEEQAQQGPWRDQRGTLIALGAVSTNLDLVKQRIGELALYLPEAR